MIRFKTYIFEAAKTESLSPSKTFYPAALFRPNGGQNLPNGNEFKDRAILLNLFTKPWRNPKARVVLLNSKKQPKQRKAIDKFMDPRQ